MEIILKYFLKFAYWLSIPVIFSIELLKLLFNQCHRIYKRSHPAKILVYSYLLLITIPWLIYSAIGLDGFRFPDHEENRSIWDLLYFSMVTVSTLGYGEIQPVNVSARTIAAIQSVLGPVTLAFYVSNLFFAFSIERDYKTELNRKKEAFGNVQGIRRKLYANLTYLFETIVHDADPAPSGEMSVNFHDFDETTYPFTTTQHDAIHRHQEARLHVLTLYGSHGDVYKADNLIYINRIDRQIAHNRRKIERFYYGDMSYPDMDNEFRIRVHEILNQLENIEFITSEINSMPPDSPIREATKGNYFDRLWYTLQIIHQSMAMIESLNMQGVTIGPVCPDPTEEYTPFDIEKHFSHWRTHKLQGGIQFISKFKNELDKS